jgi:carbon-monoxide dehydrogenase iron sulfur subunit
MACPFGAISIKDGNAHKCNHCAEREDGPACVRACSKRAIAVHDIANVIKRKQREHIEKMYGLDKPAKKKGLLSVITTDTRARGPLDGD